MHILSENGLSLFLENEFEFTWEKRILRNFKKRIIEIKGIQSDFVSEEASRNGSEMRRDLKIRTPTWLPPNTSNDNTHGRALSRTGIPLQTVQGMPAPRHRWWLHPRGKSCEERGWRQASRMTAAGQAARDTVGVGEEPQAYRSSLDQKIFDDAIPG